MRVVIGSDAAGMPLKELVKETLLEDGHEVVDLSETPAADFVDSATAVAADLLANEARRASASTRTAWAATWPPPA